MCLISFSWQNHPQYKLILVANRDEFYQRKTQAANFWSENPQILAGKDLEAGGTWMGIHKNGRFSALTNYRDLANLRADAPSRGQLTANFLQSQITAKAYLESISPEAARFNGYNIIVGNLDELFYFSNYQNQIRELPAGLYGLSNHLLNTDWFKVKKAKSKLAENIEHNQLDINYLLDSMADREIPNDEQVQRTGLPIERERMLSPMFIQSTEYGTCCSTVVLVNWNNEVSFTERVYNHSQKPYFQQTFEFKV
jgi:uncharacterized protein with NRDE domain